MTKSELYNKIVDVYKKTGQGLSWIVPEKSVEIRDLLSELIEDGLIKRITITYTRLPDDTWYCLTKGYCVEEESSDGIISSPLMYLRFYLGNEMVVNMGKIQLSSKECIKNPDFIEKYSTWLTKNTMKLEEMKNIEYLVEEHPILSDVLKKQLIKTNWYKNNLTVSSCLLALDKSNLLSIEKIDLLNRIILLSKRSEEHKKDISKREEEIVKTNSEISDTKGIIRFLSKLDPKKKIQDII